MYPNSEVYGTPDTWAKCGVFYAVGDGDSATKTIAPQICVWDSTTSVTRKGSLSRALNAGKVEAGVPIDATICPCGQDSAVSCFGKIGLFTNHSDTDANKIPDRIVSFTDPVNWYFSEISRFYPNARDFTPQLTNRESNICRWSPNGDLTNSNNQNRYVTPFVYYQLKSIFANIVVNTITGYDNMGRPYIQSMTLDDWKNNHSDRKINLGILQLKGITSHTDGTIQYTSPNLDPYLSVGVSLLNDVDGITDYYTYYTDRRQEVRLFGDLYSNAYNTADTFYMLAYDMFENVEVKSVFEAGQTEGGWRVWQEIPYSEANYEAIMKMAACFGIPFSPTSKTQFAEEFTDYDLYLPVIDENGIAHGEYTHGLRNVANPLYDMDGVRDINYNPSQKTDPNTYSVTTGFNTVGVVASTTKAYVVNGAALIGLSGELWSIVGNLITNPEDVANLDNLALDAFLTSNPIDAIVSVKKFPLLSVPHGENLINVKLGKYTTSAGGYDLAMQQARYNFTGIPIFPKFGNCFLDYSPYTKMQLYVPFCGTIDIDAADFMGRTLSVEMCIDFITGAVTAYVLANQLVVTSLTGTCAVDIPITGTEQATINSALESATIAERQARHKMTMSNWGVLTHPIKTFTSPLKTLSSTIDPALNLAQREYELTHINTPLRQIGQASPLNAWELEFVCRLIIYYPDGECIQFNATNEPKLIDDKVKAFGAVNGFATVETDTLSNFAGFTQVSDADLTGVSATDTEKGMILNLLQTGVYL